MSNILDKLNEKQKEAVLQTEGPVLILAGAGSGKTRALTFRIAYLIKEKKIPPKNILAVTFTNKAAGEMLARIKTLLNLPKDIPPFSAYLPHTGTFHSICARILRKEIERIGYDKNFAIYDETDQLALMKKVMKNLDVSSDQIKPKAILYAISSAKNKLLDEKDFTQQAGDYFEETVAKCYQTYQAELKKANALDFDDLILLVVKIFQKFPKILENYQNLFRYIMVDEYQDTNHAQYVFLKLLAQKHKNICVVGDDWQSIYGWRQADIKNILSFERDYPNAKVVLLEQNYRSSQNILNAAHCVISKNINQKKKKLWTENSVGDKIFVVESGDETDEADFVASEIEKSRQEEKVRYDDFAVLYRTNAQSRALEEAFMKRAIPYKIVGGLRFYQRKEIKDILAYISLIKNASDKIAFERAMGVPRRGIGKQTLEKIFSIAEKEKKNAVDFILEDLEKVNLNLSKQKVLTDFAHLIKNLEKYSKEKGVSKTIQEVYEKSGYELMLSKEGEEGQIRNENVRELLTVAMKYDNPAMKENEEEYDGLEKFLEEVALISQADRDLEEKDVVPLMTLHSAKGLEFKNVFIVGAEEGLLPHSRAVMNENEMEEERRLCYVGITRAKEKAYMIFTSSRSIYGSTQISIRSRFLDEIDENLTEEIDIVQYDEGCFFDEKKNDRKFFSKYDRDNFDAEKYLFRGDVLGGDGNFKDGERVKHSKFGKGVVVSQDENIITVVFAGVGIKKLSRAHAGLERLG